jgi:membrane-associated protease RseP (regulator of RpoE activity)
MQSVFGHLLWLATAFIIAYIVSSVIHELAHWFFFRRYRLPVVEISFGVLRFLNVDGRALHVWTPDRPFDFLCSCKGLRAISHRKRVICLFAGGAANLVIAVMLAVCLPWAAAQPARHLIFVLIAACAANACINIANPFSTDRKLLRTLREQEENKHRGSE